MLRVVEALEARFLPHANREFALTGRAAASINVIRGGSAGAMLYTYRDRKSTRLNSSH